MKGAKRDTRGLRTFTDKRGYLSVPPFTLPWNRSTRMELSVSPTILEKIREVEKHLGLPAKAFKVH